MAGVEFPTAKLTVAESNGKKILNSVKRYILILTLNEQFASYTKNIVAIPEAVTIRNSHKLSYVFSLF